MKAEDVKKGLKALRGNYVKGDTPRHYCYNCGCARKNPCTCMKKQDVLVKAVSS